MVQPQAVLLTVSELLGYVVLAGLGILLFVLLTRMRPLFRSKDCRFFLPFSDNSSRK